MNKKLINNLEEYREFAFDILSENNNSHVSRALGCYLDDGCWDYNDNDDPIDEKGNIIPDTTPQSLELDKEIETLDFPIVVLHSFYKDWDRTGNFEVCLCEFVSLKDFEQKT